MDSKLLFLLIFIFASLLSLSNCTTQHFDKRDENKLDTLLRNSLEEGQLVDILVSFREGTAEALAKVGRSTYQDRSERVTSVYTTLVGNAKISQKRTLQLLAERFPDIEPISFWITNQLYIKNADEIVIQFLEGLEDVTRMVLDPIINLDQEFTSAQNSIDSISPRAGWGVNITKAEEVWKMPGGNNGTGIIVGIIDSGVRRTHHALADNFLGDYGWFDAYDHELAPFDDNGHGTHVTGTIVGSLGFGVAPGAKWSACKALTANNTATGGALIFCGQFMTCPTDPMGNNRNCSMAPHIINNSWGVFSTMNPGSPEWFNQVLDAWHAAGIIPVFSNGNDGSNCSTVAYPADQDVIAVGATTPLDALAGFSSRGPSRFGGVKPDVCAPGTQIISASYTSDDGVATMQGTSMAAPHVAGIIALLKSHNPKIGYKYVKDILQITADIDTLVTEGTVCVDKIDSSFPNNQFGYGRVNALTAMQTLMKDESKFSKGISMKGGNAMAIAFLGLLSLIVTQLISSN